METKLREVTIEEYWTSIVKGTAEFGEIAVAENPEFNNLAKCIYQALCDGFIDEDMSEYGVSRWEHILGITPVAGSSLDDRKAAILTHLSVKIPYTWRVLKQMLIPIIGSEDKFEMSLNNEMGELDIKFKIPASETPMEAIEQLMERVLPMNLVTVYDYDIETLMPILNDGLSEMLGEGQFVLEYIADEKKVVAHTDRVDELTVTAVENLLGRVLPENIEVERYNHNMEISWRDINKYAACEYTQDLYEVNPDYKNDLTSDGEWIYPLPALKNNFPAYPTSDYKDAALCRSPLTRADVYLPNCKGISSMFRECPNLKWLKINAPKATSAATVLMFSSKVEYFELHADSLIDANGFHSLGTGMRSLKQAKLFLPVATQLHLDNYGCATLKQLELYMPKADTLVDLKGTQVDKASALGVFATIPAYTSGTHKLTIGIHIDHQNDDEVLAAIANAEAEGWTLTVQWNGTPTAQASTFNMGTLIYARVSETENGEKYLDWGHYVTNPEEYETFRSLESAYRYFNLEMPEYE